MSQMQMRNQATGLMTPSRERIREAAKTLFAERGYESTSTAAICRLAGTSESQLVKHFENKQGALEAIFQYAWEQVTPAIRLATESISAPRQKFQMMIEMTLNFLNRDEQLLRLFLLEGRRIRNDGKQVVLVPGFLEFVKIVDGILQELTDQGELAVHPQALRSGLMGAIEGMLRDKILARSMGYPATFSDADIRSLCFTFLNAALRQVKAVDPAIRP
jgi:TetR/AcrR family transcriptional regulator of autoinduction and epiphytic fitness